MLKPKKRLVKAKLKEDRFVIFTAQAEAWFETHRRELMYGAVAVVVVVAGIFVYNWSRTTAANNAMFDELLVRDAFARSDLDSAMIRADAIIEDYSGTNSAAVALMVKGRVQEARAQFDDAVKTYQQVVDDYSSNKYLGFGAYYALATIALGRLDYSKAGELYSKAADKYADHYNASTALLEAGKAYEKANKYPEAKQVYRKVISDYPKSRSTDTARDNLAKLEFMH
jgi:TolA-binding protein